MTTAATTSPCPAWCDGDARPHDDWALDQDGRLVVSHARDVGRAGPVAVYLTADDALTFHNDATVTLDRGKPVVSVSGVDPVALDAGQARALSALLSDAAALVDALAVEGVPR